MSKPDASPASIPLWRRVVLWISEYDKSGIIRAILQYFGIAGTDGDRSLFLCDGSVNRGKKAGTINADVNFEGSVNHDTQSSTSSIPTDGFKDVYKQKGATNIYDEADTVNASVTFKSEPKITHIAGRKVQQTASEVL